MESASGHASDGTLNAGIPAAHGWTLKSPAPEEIQRDRLGDEQAAFYLVTSASFIESGSQLYGQNLLAYFAEDAELSAWLQERWEPEERHHGQALRAYVEGAWPDFPWEAAFAEFMTEYSRSCTLEMLQSTPVLELAARCMVETGTSCYYRALRDAFSEPALVQLMDHIAGDEVGHYRQFYRFFRSHAQSEGFSRLAVARTLLSRLIENRTMDTDCAIRHVYQTGFRIAGCERLSPAQLRPLLQRTLRPHFPFRLAVEMLIRPLTLPTRLRKASTGFLVHMAPLFL